MSGSEKAAWLSREGDGVMTWWKDTADTATSSIGTIGKMSGLENRVHLDDSSNFVCCFFWQLCSKDHSNHCFLFCRYRAHDVAGVLWFRFPSPLFLATCSTSSRSCWRIPCAPPWSTLRGARWVQWRWWCLGGNERPEMMPWIMLCLAVACVLSFYILFCLILYSVVFCLQHVPGAMRRYGMSSQHAKPFLAVWNLIQKS